MSKIYAYSDADLSVVNDLANDAMTASSDVTSKMIEPRFAYIDIRYTDECIYMDELAYKHIGKSMPNSYEIIDAFPEGPDVGSMHKGVWIPESEVTADMRIFNHGQ